MTNGQAEPAHLSSLDTEGFGVRTARCVITTEAELRESRTHCEERRVRLLVARVPVTAIAVAQACEQAGFQLMDTLVSFRRPLTSLPAEDGAVSIREGKPEDSDALTAVARAAFTAYLGHYHADPRLPDAVCDELYASWATRCLHDRDAADMTLIAELDGDLVGFTAIRCVDNQVGDLELVGVAPWARRRGIMRGLGSRALRWCRTQGLTEAVTSTHVSNIGAQRSYVRLGFEPVAAHYTFHAWLD